MYRFFILTPLIALSACANNRCEVERLMNQPLADQTIERLRALV